MRAHTVFGLAGMFIMIAGGCGKTVIDPIEISPSSVEDESGGGGGGGEGGSGLCPLDDAGGERTGEDRQVRDMTEAEAEAWCQSYVFERFPYTGNYSAPEQYQTTVKDLFYPIPGYVAGYAFTMCGSASFGGLCLTWPTVDDCVKNLLHAPCEGTIKSLDDCIDSINAHHKENDCGPVPQDCAAFRQAASCENTMVLSWSAQPPVPPEEQHFVNCYLRVEPICEN